MSTVFLEETDSLEDLFEDSKKDKIPLVFKYDPVVLSCSAWRQKTHIDLEYLVPTEEDHELANKVRRHFMDKLVLQRLKTDRISAFREKLGAFLAGNFVLTKDEIGMLYHLPYFYFEDMEMQKLIDETATVDWESPVTRTVHLVPYTKIEIKRRTGPYRQYWWIDSDRRPYCITLNEKSGSQTLYNSIWDFASIDVDAMVYPKAFAGIDQRFFYKLVGTKLKGISVKES